MSISLQLVELPENEQVNSRQLSLPDTGGTIGRSFDCTIQLPDFNRTLSRVHAEIVKHPKGSYQIIDRSVNGVFVNGQLLGKGLRHFLADGDTIVMGAYTLLISDMESLFAAEEEPPVLDDVYSEELDSKSFSIDSLDIGEKSKVQDSPQSLGDYFDNKDDDFSEEANLFSKKNVLADDEFGFDPFEESPADSEFEINEENIEEVSSHDEEIVMLEEPNVSLQTTQSSNLLDEHQMLSDSIMALSQMVDQQKLGLNSAIAHERLMECIDKAVDRFLEDLEPDHMEDVFNDYLTGWGNRDKKYWKLYRKNFIRKQERREFHRSFSALFLEELRGNK
ncbi:signal peptide protein [Marinomonas sp. S3726]|uniref:FHA domain-containing protein n=1 Tax=Marinomonas sp. S3726 TaxID=579484 RepID=UPI0005FA334C|nr:FHA domain-containing protein [Marinomonas sp. S3726]KJZ14715.1 signal peptide protein [Marinomonas sp. S3726]